MQFCSLHCCFRIYSPFPVNWYFSSSSECNDTVQFKSGRFSEKEVCLFQLSDLNLGLLGTKNEHYFFVVIPHDWVHFIHLVKHL